MSPLGHIQDSQESKTTMHMVSRAWTRLVNSGPTCGCYTPDSPDPSGPAPPMTVHRILHRILDLRGPTWSSDQTSLPGHIIQDSLWIKVHLVSHDRHSWSMAQNGQVLLRILREFWTLLSIIFNDNIIQNPRLQGPSWSSDQTSPFGHIIQDSLWIQDHRGLTWSVAQHGHAVLWIVLES